MARHSMKIWRWGVGVTNIGGMSQTLVRFLGLDLGGLAKGEQGLLMVLAS